MSSTELAISADDLNVRIEARVISTNIEEFEDKANAALAAVDFPLENDSDFAAAKKAVKSIEKVEKEIIRKHESILSGITDVNCILSSLKLISKRFCDKRLFLSKKVKDREQDIKNGIINDAIERASMEVTKLFMNLGVEPSVDYSIIRDAAKNKRTIDSLRDAVNRASDVIISEQKDIALVVLTNKQVEISEEHKHLFPDIDRLVLMNSDDFRKTVYARIDAFESDKKNKSAEEEATRRENEEKAEPYGATIHGANEGQKECVARDATVPVFAKEESLWSKYNEGAHLSGLYWIIAEDRGSKYRMLAAINGDDFDIVLGGGYGEEHVDNIGAIVTHYSKVYIPPMPISKGDENWQKGHGQFCNCQSCESYRG